MDQITQPHQCYCTWTTHAPIVRSSQSFAIPDFEPPVHLLHKTHLACVSETEDKSENKCYRNDPSSELSPRQSYWSDEKQNNIDCLSLALARFITNIVAFGRKSTTSGGRRHCNRKLTLNEASCRACCDRQVFILSMWIRSKHPEC
jgi:hypothetical protein